MKFFPLLALLCSCTLSLFSQTTSSWQQTSGPEGGTVLALARNASTVFAGTNNGFWLSNDEGAHWQSSNPDLLDCTISAVSVLGSEVLCVGEKYYEPYKSAIVVARSTDGGQTWQTHTFDSGVYIQTPDLYDNSNKIWRDGQLLWITSGSWLYRSSDDGFTWEEIVVSIPDFYPTAIAVNGNKILTFGYYGRARSEDGGISWQFTVDTSYLQSLYSEGDFIIRQLNDSISVSTDFGFTWQTAPFDIYYGINRIIRGTDNKLYLAVQQKLFSSVDGLTWDEILSLNVSTSCLVQSGNEFIIGGYGMYQTTNNVTQLEIAQSGMICTRIGSMGAMKNGRLIANDYSTGSTWSSTNEGLTWNKLPKINQWWQIFNTMTVQGDTVWAVGSNDSLYRIIGDQNQWESIVEADGWFAGETFVRILDTVVYLLESDQLRRSFDWGATWQVVTVSNDNFDELRGITKMGNYLFCSTNNGFVYRSGDNGTTWTSVLEIWSPGAHRANRLTTLGNRLFLWSEYEAFSSIDEGNTWTPLTLQGLPTDSWGDIVFEPGDILHYENLIFATIPYKGVWVSFDFGNNWEPFNNGLSNLRGRVLQVSGNKLFLGSSTSGVWRSGTNFEIFSGQVYNDLNQNQQRDANETGISNRIVGAEPLGSYSTTDANGSFTLVATSQMDTLRITAPNAYCTVTPPFIVTQQPGSGYDFAVHFTPGIIDLRADITNWGFFRPGFDNTFTVTIENTGNETVNSSSAFIVLPSSLTVLYTEPFDGVNIQGDTIFWTVPTLTPFSSVSLLINVTLSANQPLGSTLVIAAMVEVPNDVALDNNRYELTETVVGSYDPNDKSAAERIHPQDLAAGKPIEYVVRFENTGTFYAEKVVIRDPLQEELNPSTIHFIASSHPCTWRITSDGILEFTFNDMFLLPEETGFVKFSIEADRTLQLNDKVTNTAEIYFDFNAPIITNTTETTVAFPTSTVTLGNRQSGLTIQPNPASHVATVGIKGELLKQGSYLVLYNSAGQLIWRSKSISGQLDLPVEALTQGIYEVVLCDAFGKVLDQTQLVVTK